MFFFGGAYLCELLSRVYNVISGSIGLNRVML